MQTERADPGAEHPSSSRHQARGPGAIRWRGRKDLEDRELHELARGAARSRDAVRRREEPEDALRTRFQRDRDRIIHSTAFRRLQHKTQVLAAYEGDHVRTRLTHSLEVSQMSRSVAGALRLNADLCEAIALAHDLGHPPFGHVGEEALNERMAEHGGFRHNAQGLRIVDHLEDARGDGLGLNLTHPVRASLLKGKVPEGFPVTPDLADELTAHGQVQAPREARVVDHCDRIAYLCHDLDDGLRIGVFSHAEVGEELSLWRRAEAAAEASHRSNRVISEMVSLLIHDLVRSSDQDREVGHSTDVQSDALEVLSFLRSRFYRSRRVLDVMEQGQERIRFVFDRLLADPLRMSEHTKQRLGKEPVERTVCDYVAGMTDRYLVAQANELSRG